MSRTCRRPSLINSGGDRILAVDYGTRRIGLAVGTDRDRIATALAVLECRGRMEEAVRRVAGVARNEEASRLLVGLPLNMDGTEGEAAGRVRDFAARLGREAGLPVAFQDERLTSEAAAETIRGSGRRLRGRPVDAVAAALLLQGWFDEEAARRTRAALPPVEE